MNKYLRKTFDYAAGSFFNKLLLLLFLPIFTSYMIPEEYAVYSNLMIFFTLMSLIVLLGLQQSLFSHFYQEQTDGYKFTLMSSVYFVLIAAGIVFSFLIVIFRNQLALITVRDTQYAVLFIDMAIIIFFNTIFSISTGFLNIMEQSAKFAVISTLQNLIILILVVIFAINKQFSLQLYFHFFAISTFIAAIVSMISVIKIMEAYKLPADEKKLFSAPLIRSMLKFGLVMIPGSIAVLVLQASDRYMLTFLSAHALYDVGIYAAGYRIGMIMHFLVSLVSLVYIPYAMKIADQPAAKAINRSMYNYYILFGTVLGVSVILFGKELFYVLIDQQYFASNQIVFSGVISSFLYGIFNILNIHFYAAKKASNIMTAVVVGAVLNIILNFLFIPKFGIYGAAIASILAYLVIMLIDFVASHKLFATNYNPLYFILALIILLSAAGVNLCLKLSWILFFTKIIILIIISFFLYFYLRKNEKLHLIIKKLREIRT
ncbi:MAG TPA: oligosaccharide flippase family protein [Candidatus Cloacimonadota bacterium]|nr:oligosaccharide flippase family protein [Candidatus Cloacimonadota bacterium]